jgi:hypothetical protein
MIRQVIAACALVAFPVVASAQSQPQFAKKPEQKPVNPAAKRIALDKESAVLDPLEHANLAVFPVVSTAAIKDDVDYLVLDEGMAKNLVKVVEKGEHGDVNQLELRNVSDRPLFLMAGEVVIGGKQDRIIGKNTIVAPRTSEQVPVFCVEHGRWSGRKAEFSSAQAMAHTELRKKASFKDQGEVWKEVSAKNAKRKLSNQTDTYRRVAQDGSVKKSIESYDKAIRTRLEAMNGKERMIGFAVALGGKVVAIETFRSPSLFRKLQGKLLRSYFVEAVDHTYDPAKPPAAPSAEAITGFADKARKAKRKVVLEGKAGKTVQFDEDGLGGSEVEAEDGAPVYRGAYE